MHQTGDTTSWPAPEAPRRLQYPPPPPQGKTSGFAIASFVFGLIGGVILSVVFGIIALRRISRRGLRGRGFAIAGLVLSGLWTLLIATIVAVALLTGAERDAQGRVTDSGSESVFDLRTGDCMNDLEETAVELSVDVTPCGGPHDAEVVSEFFLTESTWPGLPFVARQAERRCPAGGRIGVRRDAAAGRDRDVLLPPHRGELGSEQRPRGALRGDLPESSARRPLAFNARSAGRPHRRARMGYIRRWHA